MEKWTLKLFKNFWSSRHVTHVIKIDTLFVMKNFFLEILTFWLQNLDFSRKKKRKSKKKRDARLIGQKICYYQINRFVKLDNLQFFGTYISNRLCHTWCITLFKEFLSIFLELESII
jgi:hypothetical protein